MCKRMGLPAAWNRGGTSASSSSPSSSGSACDQQARACIRQALSSSSYDTPHHFQDIQRSSGLADAPSSMLSGKPSARLHPMHAADLPRALYCSPASSSPASSSPASSSSASWMPRRAGTPVSRCATRRGSPARHAAPEQCQGRGAHVVILAVSINRRSCLPLDQEDRQPAPCERPACMWSTRVGTWHPVGACPATSRLSGLGS
jgi:hypothetical protein